IERPWRGGAWQRCPSAAASREPKGNKSSGKCAGRSRSRLRRPSALRAAGERRSRQSQAGAEATERNGKAAPAARCGAPEGGTPARPGAAETGSAKAESTAAGAAPAPPAATTGADESEARSTGAKAPGTPAEGSAKAAGEGAEGRPASGPLASTTKHDPRGAPAGLALRRTL